MKKIFFIFILLSIAISGLSQDIMTVIRDSGSQTEVQFIGVKIFIRDFGLNTLNQDLHFRYVSQNNGDVMSHDMNLKGVSNIPNIGAGIDETYGHLLINFLDGSVGYISHVLNWNLGLGVGYSTSLNKKNTLMFRAYANVFYQNISYGLGSYSDSTLSGFVINGANIGTYIKDVKYVNNLLCVSPTIELIYRGNNWDFFVGAGYNYIIANKEKLNFYRTHISIANGITDEKGNAVYSGAILPAHYILQIGIVREFGL